MSGCVKPCTNVHDFGILHACSTGGLDNLWSVVREKEHFRFHIRSALLVVVLLQVALC